jgi:hypothetical protein
MNKDNLDGVMDPGQLRLQRCLRQWQKQNGNTRYGF